MELFGIAMKARLLEIEAHSCAGAKDEASARAAEVLPMMAHCQPADMYWPEAQWIVVQALKGAGADQAADDVLGQAANWIEHEALAARSSAFSGQLPETKSGESRCAGGCQAPAA